MVSVMMEGAGSAPFSREGPFNRMLRAFVCSSTASRRLYSVVSRVYNFVMEGTPHTLGR
jgi:hypothetical protein